jgi:hypothetical protein
MVTSRWQTKIINQKNKIIDKIKFKIEKNTVEKYSKNTVM